MRQKGWIEAEWGEATFNTRTGAVVNRDLAEHLVPVNADIPEIR